MTWGQQDPPQGRDHEKGLSDSQEHPQKEGAGRREVCRRKEPQRHVGWGSHNAGTNYDPFAFLPLISLPLLVQHPLA